MPDPIGVLRSKRAVLVPAITGLIIGGLGGGVHAETNFSPKNRFEPSASSRIVIPPAQDPYPVGEKLAYTIHWMGMPIGEGEVELLRSEDPGAGPYRVEAAARGNDFLNSFFPVEDRLVSRIADDGHSEQFAKNIREGKYRAEEIVSFDYPERTARYESLTSGSKKDYPVEGRVHDVLSAFYWVRSQPMTTGDRLSTTVFNDEKIWDIVFRVKEVRRVRLPDQAAREAVVLIPEAELNGKPVGRGKVTLYVSNDARRIPLLVQLDTPFGPVSGAWKG